jgi:hypothetical protein
MYTTRTSTADCRLVDDIYQYNYVSQGKITIPSMDDSEEMGLTDVRAWPTTTRRGQLIHFTFSSRAFSISKFDFFFFFLNLLVRWNRHPTYDNQSFVKFLKNFKFKLFWNLPSPFLFRFFGFYFPNSKHFWIIDSGLLYIMTFSRVSIPFFIPKRPFITYRFQIS